MFNIIAVKQSRWLQTFLKLDNIQGHST